VRDCLLLLLIFCCLLLGIDVFVCGVCCVRHIAKIYRFASSLSIH
jgi:hypothetical protein